MESFRLSDKKHTKKRNFDRATSAEEPSSRPRPEQPVKRGKSFIEKLRSFRFASRHSHSSISDDTSVPTSVSVKQSLVKQARSEDNLLSPPSSSLSRPESPQIAPYRSTPVSRESTPQSENKVTSAEISAELQEYYNQKFVFDEVKEFLATRPEEGEEASANVLDEFDPEEHPWLKEETAIEQLRGFLATCP